MGLDDLGTSASYERLETEWDAAGRWVAQRTYYADTLNQTVARDFGCD